MRITRLIKPATLPALDLAGVIPEEYRTLVAMPILLSTHAELEEALANLESQYLASARGELYFALLADGIDASQEVRHRRKAIELGRRRGGGAQRRAMGADSGRSVSVVASNAPLESASSCWMGWERKRGKLAELNRLLRGASDTSFRADRRADAGAAAAVRYVLVLDADTQLPHGAAEKLIAKMSHPLNQPQFDARSRGSGGLRHPAAARHALAARAARGTPGAGDLSGTPGLDPYAFAVSDLYQDLFGEGSFTGKGLYDIDAFESSLRGASARTPSSATICSRACSRVRRSPRTSRSSSHRPTAMTSSPRASTAGRAGTGSCCRGCVRRYAAAADRDWRAAFRARSLEAHRQPAPHARTTGHPGALVCGLAAARRPTAPSGRHC